MSLTNEQKHQLNKLFDYRDQMVDGLFHIEHILKIYFPEEFDVAYQHWIPQITTALYEHRKWLSRGPYSMQHTLDKLSDKTDDNNDKGVSKYI